MLALTSLCRGVVSRVSQRRPPVAHHKITSWTAGKFLVFPPPKNSQQRSKASQVHWNSLLVRAEARSHQRFTCLLYTSDAADDLLCVDLGGRRIIKKKNRSTI